MADNNLEEILRSQRMFADMSEFDKQQAREDLEELKGKTKKVTFKVQATVKSFRKAADKLDKVWKDCKIAQACGTASGIVGGILIVAGGVATMTTAGAATPLILAGMGFGAGGTVTKLGTSRVDSSINSLINSAEIKKAEKDLKEALDCINDVGNTVQLWLDRKEEARLLFILGLAVHTLQLTDPVIKLLRQVFSHVSLSIPKELAETTTRLIAHVKQACAQAVGEVSVQAGVEAAGQAGAQTAVRAGGLIIAFTIPFLIWDAIDLGFTIRDLIENKGSEAADVLREKANELEQLY